MLWSPEGGGLGVQGWWLLPGSASRCRNGDMPCGQQLGQPHGRDSIWDSSIVTVDRVLCVSAMACGHADPHSM